MNLAIRAWIYDEAEALDMVDVWAKLVYSMGGGRWLVLGRSGGCFANG